MLLRAWYFVTVILTALLMGTSFAHTLEMPPKMAADGVLWMTFQHTLYPYFAYAGAPVELGSIVGVAGLSFLLRGRRPAFYQALGATLCLATAFFVVWLGFTNVVNAETATWTADSIPKDWAAWRSQWEYSHATRVVLHLASLVCLVVPWIASLPGRGEPEKRSPAGSLHFLRFRCGTKPPWTHRSNSLPVHKLP